MKYLELSLPTPAENLAADEVLLDLCEAEGGPGVLRLWQPSETFVVVGCGNQVRRETRLEACRQAGVPVLRRCSGGGTVVQAPGCLNYAVILPQSAHASLGSIGTTNAWIMETLRQGLSDRLGLDLQVQGVTDLAMSGRKCAGNAQRRKRSAVLFHGCFLLSADLEVIERLLPAPSREPDYRRARNHLDFLVNLDLPARHVARALRETWCAHEPFDELPLSNVAGLVHLRYGRDEWNFRS